MAEIEWTEMTDSLSTAAVERGVTNGIPRPAGGGSFVFGYNSLATSAGAVGFFTNQVNYAPMAKGGSIRGVLQRGVSGGPSGFSPFFFIGAQGPSVNDSAYLLGLSDEAPSRIVLKKGALVTGIPAAAAQGVGVLDAGLDAFSLGEYVHLRMDMTVNLNGDVLLDVFENDLNANPLGAAPVWQRPNGTAQFVDDTLGINSGSPPFLSGRAGFGFHSADVSRRGFFDHLEVFRQL